MSAAVAKQQPLLLSSLLVPPSAETSKEEKAQIRAALPAGLHDPDSKIRTAIAMAIAAVANWDWPQDWPGLLENIVTSIKERRNPNLGRHCQDRPAATPAADPHCLSCS